MRQRLPLLAALLVATAGCDDVLTTEPVDRIPSERAIVDAGTARAALIGAYDGLQALSYYGRTMLVLGDLSSDNARHTGTFQYLGAIDRFQVSADNSAINSVWNSIYDAISRVNLILDRVPDIAGMDEEERDQILGEAHFLRALHYHNLVKFWGGVPLVLAPVTDPSQAGNVTRATAAAVYTQINADLDQAEALITDDAQTRQASIGAVHALRARVKLYQGDYQAALDATDEVLALGYELADSFTDLFTTTGDETSEDIFRVGFTAVEYNEMGYYYLGAGRREVQPTTNLNTSFEAGDERKAATVAPRGSSNLQGVKFPTTVGSEHIHVIRLAEVLLIRAEALARLGQLQEAVDTYNPIRERAGLSPHVLGTDVTTQDEVLAAIDKERRMELALEGDRFPDLVRTGRAATVLAIPAEQQFQLLYPIPAAELVVAPGLTQNPGY